jgi:hypothetical protein
MRFQIDFFKTTNLTPDEWNMVRRGASGLWLIAGNVDATDPKAALVEARVRQGEGRLLGSGCKIRIGKE